MFSKGRTIMPRQARVDTPETLHHVIIRGIEKKRIVENCGIPAAETGRQVGVSSSAMSKMIRRGKSNSIEAATFRPRPVPHIKAHSSPD
jgi:hypothetical protein